MPGCLWCCCFVGSSVHNLCLSLKPGFPCPVHPYGQKTSHVIYGHETGFNSDMHHVHLLHYSNRRWQWKQGWLLLLLMSKLLFPWIKVTGNCWIKTNSVVRQRVWVDECEDYVPHTLWSIKPLLIQMKCKVIKTPVKAESFEEAVPQTTVLTVQYVPTVQTLVGVVIHKISSSI